MELKKKRRTMNKLEQQQLKKSYWVLFLVVPLFLFFLSVAYYFDSLPLLIRYAAVIIPTLVVMIFTQHHFKKVRDLSYNEVEVYTGRVTKKVFYQGMRINGKRRNRSKTRYILVSGKKFYVSAIQFKNCEEGKRAIVVTAPQSQMILSVSSDI